MLFDLRGRGRRRTVQAIYLSLAILMGGGLVLFGIGSDQSGGIVDAVVGDGSGGDTATETLDNRIKSALAKTQTTPREPAPWAELARLRFQRAGIDGIRDDGTYTAKGKEQLTPLDRGMGASIWRSSPSSPTCASRGSWCRPTPRPGSTSPPRPSSAMQLVTAAEDPPSTRLYQQLAQLAYVAGDTRTGDLAAERAVDLAPKEDRESLRESLKSLKTQATAQPATGTTTPASG